MKERSQSKKIAVRGKEVCVGIDVHKESWQVTVRTEGEEVFRGRIASDYRVLGRILNRFAGSMCAGVKSLFLTKGSSFISESLIHPLAE